MFKTWRKNRLQDKLEVAEAKLAFEYECAERSGEIYPIVVSRLIGEITLLKAKLRRLK